LILHTWELRRACKRGLPEKGGKQTLVARLLLYDAAHPETLSQELLASPRQHCQTSQTLASEKIEEPVQAKSVQLMDPLGVPDGDDHVCPEMVDGEELAWSKPPKLWPSAMSLGGNNYKPEQQQVKRTTSSHTWLMPERSPSPQNTIKGVTEHKNYNHHVVPLADGKRVIPRTGEATLLKRQRSTMAEETKAPNLSALWSTMRVYSRRAPTIPRPTAPTELGPATMFGDSHLLPHRKGLGRARERQRPAVLQQPLQPRPCKEGYYGHMHGADKCRSIMSPRWHHPT